MAAAIHRGLWTRPDHRHIEWASVEPAEAHSLIFSPPLIGGHFTQQLRLFRWVTKIGFGLFSFNYSGHGRSSDKFSLRTSIKDTFAIAKFHSNQRSDNQLPICGIACCYAAIPLIIAACYLKEPFNKLVLINPLPDYGLWALIRSFTRYYLRFETVSFSRKSLWKALWNYADFLFPHIPKDRHSFGALQRKRAKMGRCISDFILQRPLAKIRLKRTRVFCLYSRDDRFIQIYDGRSRFMQNYEERILQICPNTRFKVMDTDHYFTDPVARELAKREITTFLNAA
jgi:hypothetical protein